MTVWGGGCGGLVVRADECTSAAAWDRDDDQRLQSEPSGGWSTSGVLNDLGGGW